MAAACFLAIDTMKVQPAVSIAICHCGNVMIFCRNRERENVNCVRVVRNIYNDGTKVCFYSATCRLLHDKRWHVAGLNAVF